MADDIGLLDNYEQLATCSTCERELEWVECEQCEDGQIDVYDSDPMWYDPGDTEPCEQCGGAGGWYWCATCKGID